MVFLFKRIDWLGVVSPSVVTPQAYPPLPSKRVADSSITKRGTIFLFDRIVELFSMNCFELVFYR